MFFFYFRYKLYGSLQKIPCELLEFSLSTRHYFFLVCCLLRFLSTWMTKISGILMIFFHGHPESRKNIQVDIKPPEKWHEKSTLDFSKMLHSALFNCHFFQLLLLVVPCVHPQFLQSVLQIPHQPAQTDQPVPVHSQWPFSH